MITEILMWFAIACYFIASMISIRGYRVSKFRSELFEMVMRAMVADALAGESPDLVRARLDKYQEVTYGMMMHKFWKPLRSFYQDYSFVKSSHTIES